MGNECFSADECQKYNCLDEKETIDRSMQLIHTPRSSFGDGLSRDPKIPLQIPKLKGLINTGEKLFKLLGKPNDQDTREIRDLPLIYLNELESNEKIWGKFEKNLDRNLASKGETKPPIHYTKLNVYYKGDWKNDKFHGFGILITRAKQIYQGYFLNGSPEGKGRIFFPNGDLLRGNFKTGKIKDKGVYVTQEGSRYVGPFVDNRAEGVGVEQYSEGGCYEGHFVQGKKHGKGKLELNAGTIIEGKFVKGMLEGKKLR
jgi:hypothetical protein